MNSDKSQDKYDEIVKNLKSEKMDWDFEDFMQKTEDKTSEISTIKPKKYTLFWLAASLILIFGIGFFFINDNKNNADDTFVKNEILKQKNDFAEANTFIEKEEIENDSVQAQKDSTKNEETPIYQSEEKIMNKILSKKERLRKKLRPNYAVNEKKSSENNYQSDFVIINGKKIENEKEAVELTKIALNLFANNLNNTLQEAQPVENLTVEF